MVNITVKFGQVTSVLAFNEPANSDQLVVYVDGEQIAEAQINSAGHCVRCFEPRDRVARYCACCGAKLAV